VETVEVIGTLWPIFLGFVTLVIILARLWTDVEVVKEKVRTLFELINRINNKK
jgi:hypothetical protein